MKQQRNNAERTLQVIYQLECMSRRDEDSKVFVGYIPSLRLFTQSKTEDRLKRALRNLASMFIATCWERGILEKELKARGMQRADTPAEFPKPGSKKEFIAIGEYDTEFTVDVEVKLPVEGLATTCLQ